MAWSPSWSSAARGGGSTWALARRIADLFDQKTLRARYDAQVEDKVALAKNRHLEGKSVVDLAKAQGAGMPQIHDNAPRNTIYEWELGDAAAVADLWLEDDDVVCVHPGGPRLTGHGTVRASWAAILANGPLQDRKSTRLNSSHRT